MKTYIVQLEDHDDVISARDKITWSKARRVILIWPHHGRVLERRVDLLLIQRHCQQLGLQLGIVSRAGDVRTHAADLGIPVFASAAKAQQAAWRRPRVYKALEKIDLRAGRPAIQPHALREQMSSLRSAPPVRRRLQLVMFCAGVLSFLALVLFFAPGARVTVSPERLNQAIHLPVRVQPGISSASPSGDLPAARISVVVEGRDQALATSKIKIGAEFSRGEVVFTNLTDRAVEIPQGSIVLTTGDSPARYMTLSGGRLPKETGSTRTIPVQAVLPGSAGNMPSGRVRAVAGGLGALVAVDNLTPLRGGTDRTSPSPSSQDDAMLREKMLADLKMMALEELRARAGPGQRMLEESVRMVEVKEETRIPGEGQPADLLQLTLQVEFEAWLVEEQDLAAVSRSALDANLPKGYQSVPETLAFEIHVEPPSGNPSEPAALPGELTARREIKPGYSAAELIQGLPGRTVVQARSMIETRLKLAGPPQVEIYPAWWQRMPFLPFRIELVEQ